MNDEAEDRRTDVTLRNAVVRLRLAEYQVSNKLSPEEWGELTDSIDDLVAALRRHGVLK